ncbi:peroxide stress protein YaaA [Desulforhopalus sp. 52FAK]
MQLITAPSKTQEFNGRIFTGHTLPQCLATSLTINNILQKMTRDELSTRMKTSAKLTESTYQRIQNFETPFTIDNAKQAIFTFQGDAYDAIDAENYSAQELEHAQKHLNILSGLYGLLRPLDLMQPYRLEMGLKLAVGNCKNLYQLWRDEITGVLNKRLAQSTDATVVNLASTEYSKVIDRKQLQGKIIEVAFQQEHKGQIKTIPIHSKRARGMMIHYAISNRIEQARQLQQFDLDGYGLDSSKTTDTSWVFVRK